MRTFIVVLLAALSVGCAQKGIQYYWGDYSQTLYSVKKSPSPETEQRHLEELNEIITKSAEKGYRVPPGVQAELGYIYAKSGKTGLAATHFNGEVAAYPESQYFVEKLQRMLDE